MRDALIVFNVIQFHALNPGLKASRDLRLLLALGFLSFHCPNMWVILASRTSVLILQSTLQIPAWPVPAGRCKDTMIQMSTYGHLFASPTLEIFHANCIAKYLPMMINTILELSSCGRVWKVQGNSWFIDCGLRKMENWESKSIHGDFSRWLKDNLKWLSCQILSNS